MRSVFGMKFAGGGLRRLVSSGRQSRPRKPFSQSRSFSSTSVDAPLHQFLRDIEMRLAAAQSTLKTDLAADQAALKTDLAAAQVALKTDLTGYFEKNNYRQAAILMGACAIGAGFGLSVATFCGYAFTGKASAGKQV